MNRGIWVEKMIPDHEPTHGLRERFGQASILEETVGNSEGLQTVLASIRRIAPTDTTVLVSGETGTGKELVARAIHKQSRRASRPFVSVNCAAIPAAFVASELFGHEMGALPGALRRRIGRFDLAEGGTIFLDEIGALPPETQIALLRVLERREFEPVGGHRSIRADVRVIAASNRNLKAAVAQGSFRADLFYRLNVSPVHLPPRGLWLGVMVALAMSGPTKSSNHHERARPSDFRHPPRGATMPVQAE